MVELPSIINAIQNAVAIECGAKAPYATMAWGATPAWSAMVRFASSAEPPYKSGVPASTYSESNKMPKTYLTMFEFCSFIEHVFFDWDAESQGDLPSNAWTAPGGIALLHLDDGFNEFFVGPLWSGLTPALGWEEQAIFLVPQSPVEAQKGRRLQYDCSTDQAGGANEESTQTGDKAI